MMIPEDISRSIQGAKNIVLLTHVHPDGDALGSLLGFANILDSLGKKVQKLGNMTASPNDPSPLFTVR